MFELIVFRIILDIIFFVLLVLVEVDGILLGILLFFLMMVFLVFWLSGLRNGIELFLIRLID